ncbi:nucleoporin Nup157/170 [Schizosaccharomyces japonicus yFS275]|uniref:Nucleoporin Nup157/170 n=1 Tax=Schizosaccharomyces japonicus (strain yFS275 / FY16936) TaxID=402676 RepID=B6K135_SCHJY|nr:nucleoporin Nup157/170 [Schizosaccharomyces japonicus yFS275]EEB07656.1 nucleoporin Nup157/170 [Schizosaccharomyces japonicus yFS275]
MSAPAISHSEDGLYDILHRGSSAIETAEDRDSKFPDLGNIIGQGYTNDYTMPTLSGWKPFFRREVISIPDIIFEQYNRTECFTQMGLFAEIQRAWITVDNRLFLWDFMSEQNFQAYEELKHTITCIKLVRPRESVFVDDIKYLLVIATTQDMLLLGVSIDSTTRDLSFYHTKMQISIGGIGVNCIEATLDGRIFFSGRQDSNLYEFVYQSEEGWFSKRCAKVNLTASSLGDLLPSFMYQKGDKEFIEQIAIDDSRKLLYTLTNKSSVVCYKLEKKGIQRCVHYSYRSMLSQAQMLNASSVLLDPRFVKLVSIVPIPSYESQQIYAVVITSSGCRLYMRGGRSTSPYFQKADFADPQSAYPSTLQITHIRFPPDQTTDNKFTQRQNATGPFMTNVSQMNGPQNSDVGKPVKPLQCNSLSTMFTPGLFFAFTPSSQNDGDLLFAAAPEFGKIANLQNSGNQLMLCESAMFLPIEGYVQGIICLNPSKQSNELVSQFTTPAPVFAILTNTGVHIIVHRRPLEILMSAIRVGASLTSGVDSQVRTFFESCGRAEGCATCLGLVCGLRDSAARENGQSYFGSSKSTQPELIDIAKKYYIEFGGKTFIDQSRYNSQQDVPSLEFVRLSGRHDGLASCISRLVRWFWGQPVVTREDGKNVFKLNADTSLLLTVQSHLLSLYYFLDISRNHIEGLAGPDHFAGFSNTSDEFALQAEHRALHALITVLKHIIEGISFVILLNDSTFGRFNDIVSTIAPPTQEACMKLTFGKLFTSKEGRVVAKELVNTLVNRQLASGDSIDTVSQILRKKCGSFCSADDVLIYKAIELLWKARDALDADDRASLISNSFDLFKKAARVFSLDDLKDAVKEYKSLGAYDTAVKLILHLAATQDLKDIAFSYMADGQPEDDPRKKIFDFRIACYELVFSIFEEVESLPFEESSKASISVHDILKSSKDELFHTTFYDWYISKGMTERLLDIDSPYIQSYLERNSGSSLSLASLLWQYYAKREMFYMAALVLLELALSAFPISLEQRIEYLTRAKGFGNCHIPSSSRANMNKIMHQVVEYLDVASIQDDLLIAIKNDARLSKEQKDEVVSALDGQILNISEIFNKYADPMDYGEICLSIFQASGYAGIEVVRRWERIIQQTHDQALHLYTGASIVENVSSVLRKLTIRFSSQENVFPVEQIIALAEKYAYEYRDEESKEGWVPDTFTSAGVSHEVVFIVLNQLYDRREKPWQTKEALLYLILDLTHLLKSWCELCIKGGLSSTDRPNFNVSGVLESIEKYKNLLVNDTSSNSQRCKKELQLLENTIREEC